MTSVCYQIHTHRSPEQVVRLVRHLVERGTDPTVVISHDAAAEPLPVGRLEALGDVHVIRSRGGWGDFSHVDRWMEAARWLRTHDVPYDWMVTLSGQDYPVAPLRTVENELAEADVDGFTGQFPVFSPDSHWPARRAYTRYFYRHARPGWVPDRVRPVIRAASAVNLVQPFVRLNASFKSVAFRTPTPFGPGFALYGGSFWVTVRRACVEHALTFYDSRPAVVRYFRGTLAPDEVFVHTVLAAGGFRLSSDSKRFYDFGGRSSHPRVLEPADVPRLLGSRAHFARKFDLDRGDGVLDSLDRALA